MDGSKTSRGARRLDDAPIGARRACRTPPPSGVAPIERRDRGRRHHDGSPQPGAALRAGGGQRLCRASGGQTHRRRAPARSGAGTAARSEELIPGRSKLRTATSTSPPRQAGASRRNAPREPARRRAPPAPKARMQGSKADRARAEAAGTAQLRARFLVEESKRSGAPWLKRTRGSQAKRSARRLPE